MYRKVIIPKIEKVWRAKELSESEYQNFQQCASHSTLISAYKEISTTKPVTSYEVSVEDVTNKKIYAYLGDKNEVLILTRDSSTYVFINMSDANNFINTGHSSIKAVLQHMLTRNPKVEVFEFPTQEDFFEWGFRIFGGHDD